MTASRPVCRRASLTAFSTASVPALKNAHRQADDDRRECAEPLGELDVRLVRDHGEVRVQEALGLGDDRLDHSWMVVADVHDPDSSDEVDERVAVDVGDRGAARFRGDNRAVDDEWTRDGLRFALQDRPCARARDLRLQLDRARHCHALRLSRSAGELRVHRRPTGSDADARACARTTRRRRRRLRARRGSTCRSSSPPLRGRRRHT